VQGSVDPKCFSKRPNNSVTLRKRVFSKKVQNKIQVYLNFRRSQWPSGPRRRSAAAWLLESRVSNSARGMDVFLLYLHVVLSCVGRGLCDGLITRPEESYRVSVCV
jgi:hypothetical protein